MKDELIGHLERLAVELAKHNNPEEKIGKQEIIKEFNKIKEVNDMLTRKEKAQ